MLLGPSGMGRPIDADSARTWDRIVDAAREEIFEGESGATDISLRRVATAARLSLGTVHYYFSSKDELLEACLDEYYRRLASLTQELVALSVPPEHEEPRHRVARAVRRIYRFAREERRCLQLRVATNARRGELHHHRQTHVLGPFLDIAVAALQPLTLLEPREVRLTIQTMTFVVMRYALLSPSELAFIVGASADEGAAVVEEHVVQTTLRLVFPAGDDRGPRPDAR